MQYSQTFNVRLDPAMVARLDALAVRQGRSRGDMLRRLLSFALSDAAVDALPGVEVEPAHDLDPEAVR